MNEAMILAAMDAMREESRRMGLEMSLAIVDEGGHLLAFHRMAGALLASVESSQVKARTSVYFGAATHQLPGALPITPALLGCVGYPVAFVAGGAPIRVNGRVVGGVGVGGGMAEQDEAIARVGVMRFGEGGLGG